ncbi:MAG TPA: hypothetical protein VFO78_12445 [Candidatus Limnocylindrales bacterium]|nr:hypothetical protein [Candidatus Limnocylindrales bacterium]
MNSSSPLRGIALPGVALVLGLIVLAFVAGSVFGRAGSPAPSVSPSAPPSAGPSGAPTAPPTPAPSDDPSDGFIEVDLDIATPHDVSVEVQDETGLIVGASSGRAGDGMSVRWFTMKVENIDAQTVRVTWVGFPADAELELRVYELDGKVALRLLQAGPPPNSDAVGFDRVLDLEFDRPVNAEDVLTSIQGSLDTGD